jgi:DNA-binding response OmpR family regulator
MASYPGKGRILFTEDDADNRELLEYVLTDEGFEVVATDNPQAVLELAQEGGFNLFILDARLPQLSGFELCKKLREFDSTTPILFYSGAAHETDKQHAKECGAQSYLVKPASPDVLLDEILRLTTEAPTGLWSHE